jgi:hypothetical protein
MVRRIGDGFASARQAHSHRYEHEARGQRRPKPTASARVGAKPRLMDNLGSSMVGMMQYVLDKQQAELVLSRQDEGRLRCLRVSN